MHSQPDDLRMKLEIDIYVKMLSNVVECRYNFGDETFYRIKVNYP